MPTTFLDWALWLAARGFHVFPLRPGTKLPLISKFYELATTDRAIIRAWWARWPEANPGISTTRYGHEGLALVAIDVDVKGDRDGREAFAALQVIGGLPDTYTQRTPTGGFHYVYTCPFPLRQTVNELGHGIDTRSFHGYIVGVGARVAAGVYEVVTDVAPGRTAL